MREDQPGAQHEAALDRGQRLVDYLQRNPDELVDVRQLMHRSAVSAEECQTAVAMREDV